MMRAECPTAASIALETHPGSLATGFSDADVGASVAPAISLAIAGAATDGEMSRPASFDVKVGTTR